MRYKNLEKMLFDFIQALLSKRKQSTKDYFSTHIKFTTIYLLSKQGLNHK
jgi:hypothetical protein